MNKNSLNQMIIISYLIVLLLHFLVGRKHNIYPSLVFPAFSYAPIVQDNIQYPDILFYAITNQNQLIAIDKKNFFNGYKKHVNYFLSTIISNEKKFKNDPSLLRARTAFISYSIKQLMKLYPKRSFKGLQINKTTKIYNTRKLVFEKDINNEPDIKLYFKD